MARLSLTRRKCRRKINTLISAYWLEVISVLFWFYNMVCILIAREKKGRPLIQYSLSSVDRNFTLHRYVYESDSMCLSQLRMDRRSCFKLRHLLQNRGGLRATKNMEIEEQVVMFLHILAHNVKNQIIGCRFYRSGESISRHFTHVCNAVVRLHPIMLKKVAPVTEDSTDERWKWFKVHVHKYNCFSNLLIGAGIMTVF